MLLMSVKTYMMHCVNKHLQLDISCRNVVLLGTYVPTYQGGYINRSATIYDLQNALKNVLMKQVL